jgi:outer membrane protein assembly complex protein YaeT
MTPAFLATDLELMAEGMLFERRYYIADVAVGVEEFPDETVVTVAVTRGPRGARVVVELTGNDAVAADPLRAALPKPSTPEFHELLTTKRPRLRQILEVRYASLGFLQASVGEPETHFDEPRGVFTVTIPVVEGEPSVVGRIELEGVEQLDAALVRSRLTLVEGARFRITQFVQDRSALAAFYRRQGFPDVEVDSSVLPGDEPGALVARFVVREGPEVTVGDIRVAGNDTTRESVVRREVVLEPGDPLRLSDISRTQKRLYELGIFRSADVVVSEPATVADRSVRDVVVELAEAPDITFDYGARFASDGLFQVQADVGAPNLFGRAQGVGFRALVGPDERVFRGSYRTPYVGPFKVATDFFVERRIGDFDSEAVPFTERDWTLTAQQSRPVRDNTTVQWSYSFKKTGLSIEDPILGPTDITQKQSLFTAALIGDHRDSVVDPSRGSLWTVTLQGAPQFFASDFKFVKVFGQAFTFVDLGNDVIWAAGYRAGAINNLGQTLLPDDRFRAGGANSVRGFERNSLGPPLGGEALIVINQEIRFPILWRFRGVGFYDAGNVFATPSDVRLSELRHDAGLGVRVSLPFGLLRLDWARVLDAEDGEDPWRFVFSLGHAF